MTSFKKLVMCFGLLAVLGMPLAGCSGTWQGIKNDWHDVTSSNDSDAPATTQAANETAPATEPEEVKVVVDDEAPSAYN